MIDSMLTYLVFFENCPKIGDRNFDEKIPTIEEISFETRKVKIDANVTFEGAKPVSMLSTF